MAKKEPEFFITDCQPISDETIEHPEKIDELIRKAAKDHNMEGAIDQSFLLD